MKKIILVIILLLFSINIFLYGDTNVSLSKKVDASDRGSMDWFGITSAINGNYAIVGAYGEDHDENGNNILSNSGSAYIFEKVNGTWGEVKKIVASDRAVNDFFGVSVAINGNFAVVGARSEDEDENGNNFLSGAGSVYIYERVSGTWTQIQKIVPTDRASSDNFGQSVAISGDYIIVGANQEDHDASGLNQLSNAGSVYIFKNINGTWTQVQKIVANDRAISDQFGYSVAIENNYLVVGAYQKSSQGAAYIFELSNGSWSQVSKLESSDLAANDVFGISVAISGNYAVVGARDEDENENGGNTLSNAGSAYIFKRTNGSWSQLQKVVASDRNAANENFGELVAISGEFITIGSRFDNEDANNSNYILAAGSVYLLALNANDIWEHVNKISAPNRFNSDYFGISLAIDGFEFLIGAYQEDQDEDESNTSSDAGSAYIYSIESSPSISDISLVNSNNNSTTLTSTVYNRNLSTTITYEFGTSSGNYSSTTTATIITENGSVTGSFGSLNPGSVYYARVRAENSVGVSYSTEFNFTYTDFPQNHSSTFTLNQNQITQLVFNIASANSSGADGYIILFKQGSSFTSVPLNGGNYTVGTTIGDATVGAIITDEDAVEATVANLTKLTQYHFKIYPFNWDGDDITTAVYKTDGTVPSLTVVTVPTLGEWGMIAFVGLMAIGGFVYMRRRIV